MTLGGLWHGATWNYAVWGIFHGCGLAVERLLGVNQTSKKYKIVQTLLAAILIRFNSLVSYL
ncbi:MAG: hypothetical protein N4J56_005198 [Chroococcidiopsis sp. SAG 2025]|nr:hypothetical protein [Chroococcidiopsis sp. SAG 2025]